MGRFYPFDESGIEFAGKTLMIKEAQNESNGGQDGGTGLNVWDGSLLLARYLEKKPDIVRNKMVLELGSGCGLVGIASGILGARRVVMTDLSYALPLMKENVQGNRSSVAHSCGAIDCKECDWFHPPPIVKLFHSANEEVRPDVILVADCVWLSHLVPALLDTLQKYTQYTGTKVIFTYQQRGNETHEEFLRGINDIFDSVFTIDTEQSVGLAKPDVFHVIECSNKSST
ncbi:hypothetical protein ACHAWF_013663 [Thalassiosira exigua]